MFWVNERSSWKEKNICTCITFIHKVDTTPTLSLSTNLLLLMPSLQWSSGFSTNKQDRCIHRFSMASSTTKLQLFILRRPHDFDSEAGVSKRHRLLASIYLRHNDWRNVCAWHWEYVVKESQIMLYMYARIELQLERRDNTQTQGGGRKPNHSYWYTKGTDSGAWQHPKLFYIASY